MMDNKLGDKFILQVNEIFTTQREKDSVFDALKRYQQSSDLKKLVQDLKRIVNDPTKLEIYDYIRPLIRAQHQQSYDKMAPQAPSQRLRVIRLRRRMNESFGFAVRGGLEHGIGVFVSHVHPGSQAEQKGLKVGDEILRVNGFTIAEAIHEEVLNLIKGRDEIDLKVANIGMVPIKQNPADPLTWQYVDKAVAAKQQASGGDGQADNVETRKIFINLRGAPSLGCSIISGPKQFPGIYIESVRPGSLGEDYGLEVGDQIVEVNGKSFLGIKHKEAIVELKGSKELNMVIRKAAGLALMNLKNKSPKGSPDTARKYQTNQSPRPDSENSDILDKDLSERQRQDDRLDIERGRQKEEERKKQEREAAWRKEKEEEDFRKQELELQQQETMERQKDKDIQERERIAKEATRKKQLEEEKRKQEEKRREEVKKQKEEDRKKETERKRLQEREEERRKTEVLAQKRESAVLAGRLGPTRSMKPTLLGAATGSQSSSAGSTSDKVIKEVKIRKEENVSLDIAVEGGMGSPLGDKIVVADVYGGGAVDENGEILRGDQILEINGHKLNDMSATEVEEFLWQAEQNCPIGGYIRFLIAESELRASQDEVTYF